MSNVSMLDRALSKARADEANRSADRLQEERQREREQAELERWFADAVSPWVRPAGPSDYRGWLEGYLGAGGDFTHYYDGDLPGSFLVAVPGSTIALRPLHGANAVHLIVPAGARVESPEGLGHSTVYFMTGFELWGDRWVPGYRDLGG